MEKGATFSTSGLFIHTGNVVFTVDKLIFTQKQNLTNIEKKRTDRINKKSIETLEVKLNAETAGRKFKAKQKLLLKDWISILKYMLFVTSSDFIIPSYTNRDNAMKKLEEIKWKQHFADVEVAADDISQRTNNPMNQPINIPNINDILVPAELLN